MKILVIELMFSILFLSFVLLFSSLILPIIPFNTLAVYVFAYIVFSGLKSLIMFVTITVWIRNYYELLPGMIVYKAGIFKRHSHSFKLSNITALDIDQSFFGRMFNYGTIELEHPFIRQHFVISNVPNPQKCLRMIRDCTEEGEFRIGPYS